RKRSRGVRRPDARWQCSTRSCLSTCRPASRRHRCEPDRRLVKLALRIGISLVLIVLLFAYVVDAGEGVRTLQRFHPTYIVLALLVATFDRILMTYKWGLLLTAQGHHLPLFQGVMIYCSSMVWGLALPAT